MALDAVRILVGREPVESPSLLLRLDLLMSAEPELPPARVGRHRELAIARRAREGLRSGRSAVVELALTPGWGRDRSVGGVRPVTRVAHRTNLTERIGDAIGGRVGRGVDVRGDGRPRKSRGRC